MKKLLYFIFLLPFLAAAQNPTNGTKILGPVIPNGSTDTYNTHFAQLGQGGHMTKTSIAGRDSITAERRQLGMTVTIVSGNVIVSDWTLSGGTSNANWVRIYPPRSNVDSAAVVGVSKNYVDSLFSSLPTSIDVPYSSFADSLTYINTSLAGKTYDVIAKWNATLGGSRYPLTYLPSTGSFPVIAITSTGGFTFTSGSGYSAQPGDVFKITFNSGTGAGGGGGSVFGTITQFGAKADAKTNNTATIVAGNASITCTTCAFTSGDVGKVIAIPYAGVDNGTFLVGRTHLSTIATVVSATSVLISDAPIKSISSSRTISDASMDIGTKILNSASANFTNGDVGKKILIPGVGLKMKSGGSADPAGVTYPKDAWIVFVNSPTQVVVSGFALASVTGQTITIPGATIQYGSDDTQVLQTAINAAISQKRELILENGRYLTTAPLVVGSVLKIKGGGNSSAIISPVGFLFAAFKTAVLGTTPANRVFNMSFSDFEIDGSGVRNNAYNVAQKGFHFTQVDNVRFDNLYLHDIAATGLGTDYLNNYTISNCIIDHCGASVGEYPSINAGGGAGIGIGTAVSEQSAGLIIGNSIRNCGNYGIFLENQGSATYTTGVKIIGNYSAFNKVGMGDNCNLGFIWESNVARANETGFLTGGALGATTTSGRFGSETIVSNNLYIDNILAAQLEYSSGGMSFKNNEIYNTRPLLSTRGVETFARPGTSFRDDADILEISNNSFKYINGVGLNIIQGLSNHKAIKIDGNTGLNCTGQFILVNAAVERLYVKNNIAFDNRTTKQQTYGIQIQSGAIGRFIYDGNDFTGNLNGESDFTGASITTQITHFNP